jgi:two-component system sensor histidine kinase KdpD
LRSLALEIDVALRNARLYAQEQAQVTRLHRFEALQSTFFSAIAHELKTPLTVLKALVPSLQQLSKLPTEMQTEVTEILEQNLTRMETLVADLLESMRLEADAAALYRRPTNLIGRTQRVIDSLSPLLERKRRRVTLSAVSDLPLVWADGRRVEQILCNLINNAAKFAPPESTIEVDLYAVDNAVQVCVADAGAGVPPDQRERIFDKFYIAVKDKALAGTGLGLFICRELVRLHNGRIWVEDRPGGGSRFCFTLPVANEETADEKSHQ